MTIYQGGARYQYSIKCSECGRLGPPGTPAPEKFEAHGHARGRAISAGWRWFIGDQMFCPDCLKKREEDRAEAAPAWKQTACELWDVLSAILDEPDTHIPRHLRESAVLLIDYAKRRHPDQR